MNQPPQTYTCPECNGEGIVLCNSNCDDCQDDTMCANKTKHLVACYVCDGYGWISQHQMDEIKQDEKDYWAERDWEERRDEERADEIERNKK